MPTPRAALAALVALVLVSPVAARADEVRFYQTLSAPQVALGDTVTLQIVLSTGERASNAAVELPVVADLEIVSKHRSTSTQINMSGASGAQIVTQTVLAVTLRPKRTGPSSFPRPRWSWAASC